MTNLIRAWERSEEPRREFAARHGLTVSQLDYWARRVRQATVESTLVPVQVLPERMASSVGAGAAIEVALPSGARLTVPDGVSPATLAVVLSALRTVC